jgi:hypothetical protein
MGTEVTEAVVGPAVTSLTGSLSSVELRPTLLTVYAEETLRAYRARWRHFAEWSAAQGYQADVVQLAHGRLLEYVSDQVKVGRLAPATLKQTCNAVIYYAERAGVAVTDAREAKEQVRRYREARAADGVPPAYRVAGRRTGQRAPRRRGVTGVAPRP